MSGKQEPNDPSSDDVFFLFRIHLHDYVIEIYENKAAINFLTWALMKENIMHDQKLRVI